MVDFGIFRDLSLLKLFYFPELETKCIIRLKTSHMDKEMSPLLLLVLNCRLFFLLWTQLGCLLLFPRIGFTFQS